MKDVGIRELKARASDLVRQVCEEHATYTITRRGRAVGVLAPCDFLPAGGERAEPEAWDRVLALADAMGKRRTPSKSAVRELATMRR